MISDHANLILISIEPARDGFFSIEFWRPFELIFRGCPPLKANILHLKIDPIEKRDIMFSGPC